MAEVAIPGTNDVLQVPDEFTADQVTQAMQNHLRQQGAGQGVAPPAAGGAPAGGATATWWNPTTWNLPPERSGGFTGAVVRSLPGLGALPDIAGAAVEAAGVKPGGEMTFDPQRYQQGLAQRRADEALWAQQNPTMAKIAPWLGAATLAPGSALVRGAAAVEPTVTGLGQQILTGAKAGGLLGASGGVTRAAQDPNAGLSGPGLGQTARDVATDTGLGTVSGAAMPLVTPLAAALARSTVVPAARWAARNLAPDWLAGTSTSLLGGGVEPAAQAATQAAASRIAQDVAAGGPGVQRMRQQLAATPGGVGPLTPLPPGAPPPTPGAPGVGSTQLVPGTRPLTIADVAGANLGPGGLAGTVARMQGPGLQTAADLLTARDRGAPGRMLQDVSDLVANIKAQPLASVVDDLKTTGAANISRLYDAAIYDPASGAARQVMTPELARVIGGSDRLRAIMDKARGDLPGIPSNTPYSDMRLLDAAYKGVNEDLRSATGSDRYNLGQILDPFRRELIAANPDYGPAVQAAARQATTLQAIEDGQNFFGRSGPETTQLMAGYSPGDQNMFRLGAADRLARAVTSGSLGANEAIPVIGAGDYREQQIRALFPSGPAGEAQYRELINRAWAENQMKQSMTAAIGGSHTAGRLAQDQPAPGPSGWGPLLTGGAAVLHGELSGFAPMVAGAQQIGQAGQRVTPEVAGQLSRNLWSADRDTQRQFLADILALPPPTGQLLAAPVGGSARQWLPTAASWAGTAAPLVSWLRGPGAGPQEEPTYPK